MASPSSAFSPKRRPTRHDVARAAGVCLTTVTHALAPPPGTSMRDATRRRVHEAARQLGYLPRRVEPIRPPNAVDQAAVVFPTRSHLENSFYVEMLQGFVGEAGAAGCAPLLFFGDQPEVLWRALESGQAMGIAAFQSWTDHDFFDRLSSVGLPMVVVNREYAPPAGREVGVVASDNRGLVREVVQAFIARGCRMLLEVADLASVPPCDTNRHLHLGFVEMMNEVASLGIAGATIHPNRETIARQVRNLTAIGHRWDGVYVDGHEHAQPLVDTLEELGWRAGRDYLLIVSDTDARRTRQETEMAIYAQNWPEMGRRAWLMLDRMRKGGTGGREAIPYRLAVADGVAE